MLLLANMSATFRIPDKIRIRGRVWRVVRTGGRGDEFTLAEGLVGQADREQRIIKIARGQSSRQARSTFLHELIHACVRRHNPPVSDLSEENFIADIESTLLNALQQLEWIPVK